MSAPDRVQIPFQSAEGIEKRCVHARIQQLPAGVLALDFHQCRTDLAQQRGADRLVVDEGARPSVARDHPAQDQRVLRAKAVLGKQPAGRMVPGDVELGADHRLARAVTDHPRDGAGAQRQSQGVEKDRLPRPGFAGQNAQALAEGEVQTVNKDDVPDRETA